MFDRWLDHERLVSPGRFPWRDAAVLLALMSGAACGGAPERSPQTAAVEPAATTAPANPLVGVWSVTVMNAGSDHAIDPAQPGLYIFTDGYYSAVYSRGADPRPVPAAAFDPTIEEKVAQYDTLIVNTGSYETHGSTITLRPMIAKSPEFVGGHRNMTYQISGNLLTLTLESVVSGDGVTVPDVDSTMTLQRLE